MDLFPNNRKRSAHERAFKHRRNPIEGRTRAEHNAILRMCKRFAANLEYINKLTKSEPLLWLPHEGVITDQDDESVIDWRGVAENFKQDGYQIDDDGVLTEFMDPGIKATNRIQVVTTYDDWFGGEVCNSYMLRKTIFSPFPCEQWGTLPLTLAQWRCIALALIDTRINWQWEEAVNYYARSNGIEIFDRYKIRNIAGWYVQDCRRPFDTADERYTRLNSRKELTWTGTIMYRLAITGYFDQAQPTTGNLT